MKIKNQILQLRDLGYSYREIEQKLNCSKGTISYHCGIDQKQKTTNRRKSNRLNQHPLIKKIENFHLTTITPKKKLANQYTLNKILKIKIEKFSMDQPGVYNNMNFTIKELLQKIGDNPVCTLTGKPIDLMNSKSYQLDHIIARSKGGSNDLDNCQLLSKEVNMAKQDLSVEDFIQLCRDVVNYIDQK